MGNMTHPDILQMERWGERKPCGHAPVCIGHCSHCGEEITDAYIYISDKYANQFCSDDCFQEFHGYREERE